MNGLFFVNNNFIFFDVIFLILLCILGDILWVIGKLFKVLNFCFEFVVVFIEIVMKLSYVNLRIIIK